MKLVTAVCVAGLALVWLVTISEARNPKHHHSRRVQEEQSVRQVQQEEPKTVELEPAQSEEASEDRAVQPRPVRARKIKIIEPVESAESLEDSEEPQTRPARSRKVPAKIEPVESTESNEGSVEQSRPARARKAPVICNANAAAANLDKPNKVETKPKEDSIELESAESPESFEIKSVEEEDSKPKKLETPPTVPVLAPASSEEALSLEDVDDEKEANVESEPEAKSVQIDSVEEPVEPKALKPAEFPEEAKSVESEEEEKPKARRSKHYQKDVRRIRPHRRRVVFYSNEDN